jgi:site-specific DNA recombinase
MDDINITLGEIDYADYERKSSDEGSGKQILSIERQKEENNSKSPPSIYKRAYSFSESRSAFIENNRPKFNQLIELIKAGEVTGIICWHPDRLSRNPLEAGIIVDLLIKGKLKDLRFSSYTFDNTPEGIMLLQFALSQSQYFSAKLSRDVKSGNKRHLEHGQWLGPAKPGYLNKGNPDTNERYIADDPQRFQLVKRTFELILNEHYSPMEALHTLNEKWGYRSRRTKRQGGKPMSKQTFYRILASPFYYGNMDRKEGQFKGNHTPMLTEEQFELLQIRLGKRGRTRQSKKEFAFKEVLKCGECGGSITAEEKYQIICPECKKKFHKGAKTNECPECHTQIEAMKDPKILHYVFYHCTKRVHKNCTQGSIPLEDLETRINEELNKFEIDPDFRDWAINYLNELNNHEETSQTAIKDNLLIQVKDVDSQLRNLLRLRIAPQNVHADAEQLKYYDEEEKRLLGEKKDINKEIVKVDKRLEDWFIQSKETFDFACSARYQFATGDAKTKTYVLSKLGSNLTIKDKSLLISGDKPYFLIEKGKKEIASIVASLEPAKQAEIASNLLSFEPVCQSWRRVRDSNP